MKKTIHLTMNKERPQIQATYLTAYSEQTVIQPTNQSIQTAYINRFLTNKHHNHEKLNHIHPSDPHSTRLWESNLTSDETVFPSTPSKLAASLRKAGARLTVAKDLIDSPTLQAQSIFTRPKPPVIATTPDGGLLDDLFTLSNQESSETATQTYVSAQSERQSTQRTETEAAGADLDAVGTHGNPNILLPACPANQISPKTSRAAASRGSEESADFTVKAMKAPGVFDGRQPDSPGRMRKRSALALPIGFRSFVNFDPLVKKKPRKKRAEEHRSTAPKSGDLNKEGQQNKDLGSLTKQPPIREQLDVSDVSEQDIDSEDANSHDDRENDCDEDAETETEVGDDRRFDGPMEEGYSHPGHKRRVVKAKQLKYGERVLSYKPNVVATKKKRPINAFMAYVSKMRVVYANEGKVVENKDFIREMSFIWKSATPEFRQSFAILAASMTQSRNEEIMNTRSRPIAQAAPVQLDSFMPYQKIPNALVWLPPKRDTGKDV